MVVAEAPCFSNACNLESNLDVAARTCPKDFILRGSRIRVHRTLFLLRVDLVGCEVVEVIVEFERVLSVSHHVDRCRLSCCKEVLETGWLECPTSIRRLLQMRDYPRSFIGLSQPDKSRSSSALLLGKSVAGHLLPVGLDIGWNWLRVGGTYFSRAPSSCCRTDYDHAETLTPRT